MKKLSGLFFHIGTYLHFLLFIVGTTGLLLNIVDPATNFIVLIIAGFTFIIISFKMNIFKRESIDFISNVVYVLNQRGYSTMSIFLHSLIYVINVTVGFLFTSLMLSVNEPILAFMFTTFFLIIFLIAIRKNSLFKTVWELGRSVL